MSLLLVWFTAAYFLAGFILGLSIDEAIDSTRWRRHSVTRKMFVAKKGKVQK